VANISAVLQNVRNQPGLFLSVPRPNPFFDSHPRSFPDFFPEKFFLFDPLSSLCVFRLFRRRPSPPPPFLSSKYPLSILGGSNFSPPHAKLLGAHSRNRVCFLPLGLLQVRLQANLPPSLCPLLSLALHSFFCFWIPLLVCLSFPTMTRSGPSC